MKKNTLITITFFIYSFLHLSIPVQSQSCGFDFILEKSLREDALTKYRIESFNRNLNSHINQNKLYVDERANIIIPVVVHIVWSIETENISDETVLSQIDILNRDFNAENFVYRNIPDEFKPAVANVGIRFCLADKTPNGEKTTGIIRVKTIVPEIGIKEDLFFTNMRGSNAWDTERYLNIWVANTGNTITGFGTLPNQTKAEKTGVVVNSKYFGRNFSRKYQYGRVATHEIGHFFGLYHLWGQTNDESCETDDEVEDTPSQLHPYTDCPDYPQSSCGHSSMFMNFMDYVDDRCMIMFTRGQRLRILKTIELYRSKLPQSKSQCNNLITYQSKVQVFPNPFNNQITIDYSTYPLFVQLFDTNGRMILATTINESNKSLKTDFLASGIYYLKIQNDSISITKKIVKVK
jgi:Pregnancy-associated plasma protein-A/Secretion system C-terminal sorting domain